MSPVPFPEYRSTLPVMKSLCRTYLLPALLVAGLGLASTSWAQAPDQVSETIDVEIRLVPFYAVDEDGKPVFDLKQEEVELRLDGKPVAIDTFDAHVREESASGEKKEKRKGPRRHVVLFFDTAFSSPRGFETGQDFAAKTIGKLPETDLLYLVTHDFGSGLRQRLGPLAASSSGKNKMLAEIAKLKPEIGHITAETDFSMEMVGRGSGTRRGAPSGQKMTVDEPLRTTQQAQLEGTARSLAESLQTLADQFQRIHDPKLLVFLSQGIDPLLYWHGSDLKLGSSVAETTLVVKGQQFTGIHKLFEKPLQQLADSGAMSLYVNVDDQANRQRINDHSMQHMARASGGLYLGGVDAAMVSDRFTRSTTAYYEAGFYMSGDPKLSRAKLEVVVNRPGVRTWSAGAIKTRETWRGLSEEARRLLIVDLVEGESRARRPVKLTLENLPGNVQGGRTAAGTTLLQFQAGWPQELAGRKVDLYNVLLEPTRRAGSPNVLRFDRQEGTSPADKIAMELPGKTAYVWGIVAIEPATGRAWFRRFQLQGKP